MEEWKRYKLGDVCDLVAGFAFKSKDFGQYPNKVVKIADIQPPRVNSTDLSGVDVSSYDTSKLQKYVVKNGDYVLAMTGATIGKLGRIVNNIEALIKSIPNIINEIQLYLTELLSEYPNAQNEILNIFNITPIKRYTIMVKLLFSKLVQK